MQLRQLVYYLIVLIFAGIYGCATPVAPSGGPPDRTPPEIVDTSPANETTQFQDREIRITFSKFINRSTLQQALTIEPDLAIAYDISWRRKTAIIEFDRDLPENTTVIIKIGTELQDTRNNNLGAPFELAISTGLIIDSGSAEARVLRADDGRAESGMRVFLYREPFDLDARANYVAQTDTAGRATFNYLSEGTYKALWVDDLNRNRIWEPERELAQPFYDSTFVLEREAHKELGTIYVDRPDTTSPVLQGVGLLTETRMRLRFNDEIYWEDQAYISVYDSLNNEFSTAYPLYVPPEDDRVLFAQSMDALSPEQRFTLQMHGLTDRAGNTAITDLSPFQGSAQEDTVMLQIIGDNRDPGLFVDEPLIVGYSKFIDDEDVTDSLKVVVGDRIEENWEHLETERHKLIIYPDEQWRSGISYQFLVWNPAREELRPIEPVIWQRNQLGSIEITLADTLNTDEHYLTLYDNQGKINIDTTFTQSVEIEQLPPLEFTAVIFRDENENGRWDPGSVVPFQAPEPYYVRQDIPVREGFSSELTVRFEARPEQ